MLKLPPAIVLGVDPGGRHTGIVVRRGNDLLAYRVVEVAKHRETITKPMVRKVCDAAGALLSENLAPGLPVIVAVEDVVDPTPHMGTIALGSLLGTAKVLGGFMAYEWPFQHRFVTIRPGHNGAGMLGSYPADLITPAERSKGLLRPAGESALVRHCRSAWDVAGKARLAA